MGYHKKEISKGFLGKYSKIKEEFEEFTDAYEQSDSILMLCELSDIIGAIEAFTCENWNIELWQLKEFSDKTKQAFEEGKR